MRETSFIINHNGVVFEKDLGSTTDKVVRAVTLFNPYTFWTIVATDK
jgi:hypothetical protein